MSKFGKKMILLASLLILLGGAIYVFFMSPLYEVKKIEIQGNLLMSDEEVIENLGFKLGDNELMMLLNDFAKNKETVEKMDPRIQNVDIVYSDRNTVLVTVTETPLVGYLYYQGTYLWLNSNGVAIHSGKPSAEKGLTAPLLEGISITEFQLGSSVSDSAKTSLNAVNSILNAYQKYNLKDNIITINVRNMNDIVVYFDGLEIHLGSNAEFGRKAQVLYSFLEAMPDAKGTIHLEDLDGQLYYVFG